MHMEVQGCLMQVRFIEIHQVFAKKNKEYFSNRVGLVLFCRKQLNVLIYYIINM
jgi:hypothetical protein